MNLYVDCASTIGPLKPFWASTGFTPATLLLTRDMRQQLTYLGAIPRQGIRYVRVHFLLELVSATFGPHDSVHYDWSRLDESVDVLVQNRLSPIFELMGNPDGQFDDFNDVVQLQRWRILIRDLAFHLMDRYGRATVEKWYFESWNEPDIGWWSQWPHDENSFCNYYDACVAGLEDANPALIIGGPGTCQTLSSLFKTFVAHCDRGTNCLRPGQPVRLDFVSIHEKGVKPHPEDLNPRTEALIDREATIIAYLREHHPRLAAQPFMNNECDPQVGWKQHHTWHARPYYAAWMCKSVEMHLEQLVDRLGIDYAILSNDHGFIGSWGNRTLLVRFGSEQWIEDGQSGHLMKKDWARRDFTTPPFTLVKKPALAAMALLSMLGEHRLVVRKEGNLQEPAPDARLGIIATRADEGQVVVLVYYSRDTILSSGREKVTLVFDRLLFENCLLAHYRIDEAHSDPYPLWEEAGAPDLPSEALLAALRFAQEETLLEEPGEVSTTGGKLQLTFDLPLHAVSLLLLTAKPDRIPRQVTGLSVERFEGLHGSPEFLLRWDPLSDRTLQTVQILRSETQQGPFERVAMPNFLGSAVMVSQPGRYRVVARDYWGRTGMESDEIEVK